MKSHAVSISCYQGQAYIKAMPKRNSIVRYCIKCVMFLIELIFGFLLGALAGWAFGWRLGAAYVALVEPPYLSSFEEIRTWYYMPSTFANYSLCVGGLIGALLVHLHSQGLLKNRIISLYKKGVTKPQQLAHVLYQDERKIKSILIRLVQKGWLPGQDGSNDITTPEKHNERKCKMKKYSALCAIMLLTFFLFGCLPSLHPLYTEDTLIFDEQLIGKWYCEDGGSWSFVQKSEKGYSLRVVEDDGKEAEFVVHLVQLGEHRFIDLFPGDNIDLKNTVEMYNYNLMPTHTFMKLELSEPNLLLQWVYLGDLIEDDPNLLKHEKNNDGSILITAQSNDIQQVLIQNLDEILDEDGGIGKFKRCPVLFSEDDIVFDEKLLGQWESQKGEYLDIIEWENGYDILIDESREQLEFKAILYTLDNQTILGLYSSPLSQKEIQAGLHLIPDSLFLVQQIEPELKLRHLDWQGIDDFLSGDRESYFDGSMEPDRLYVKVLK